MLKIYNTLSVVMKLLIYVFIILYFSGKIYAEIYTSSMRLEELSRKEIKLAVSLRRFIKANPKYLTSQVKSVLEEAENAVKLSLKSHKNLHHPLSIYHLIRRILYDWKHAHSSITSLYSSTNSSVSHNVSSFKEDRYQEFLDCYQKVVTDKNVMPTEDDFKGTIQSILHLWSTYKLDVDYILSGEISGVKVQKLSVTDIERLIKMTEKKRKYFFEEIVLTQKLYSLVTENATEKDMVNASLLLSRVFFKHGFIKHAIATLMPHLQNGNKEVAQLYEKCLNDFRLNATHSRQLAPKEYYPEYQSLCRGEEKSQAELSTLKCYLRRTKIPYLSAKEEVVNLSPRISLFHDVLTDNEANELKRIAIKMVERSHVVGDGSVEDTQVSDSRLSQTAYLRYNEFLIVDKLDKRVEVITGFDTTEASSETLQITNYGVGGMYEPHEDFFYEAREDTYTSDTGNRIATWMFYLSDVHSGGATVFPKLRTRIPVVKGAAAFWYNLKTNGDGDEDTTHAGCPVIVGSKIIANKWIRSAAQVFRKPCGMSPDLIYK